MTPFCVSETEEKHENTKAPIVLHNNNSSVIEDSTSAIEYGTTWVAWLQVISAMLINSAASLMWLSASSSPASVSEWLQISYTSLNWLSNGSAIITSILSLATGWSYERFGIKANVCI
jgi:hypothetical protein